MTKEQITITKVMIKEIKSIFKKIDIFLHQYNEDQRKIANFFHYTSIKNDVEKFLLARIESKKYDSEDLTLLLGYFIKLIESKDIYYELTAEYKKIDYIKSEISKLNKGFSPILTFLSKKIKVAAEEAFVNLSHFMDDNYKVISNNLNTLNTYPIYTFNETVKKLQTGNFKQQLVEFLNNCNCLFDQVSNFNVILEGYDKYINKLESQIPNIDDAFTAIKKKLDRVVAEELQSKLADVSITELNKDKGGLRLSALRNNGIETFKQLYGCTPFSLMNLDGIGEATAFSIYEKYKIVEQDLLKSIKLRINYDKRTKSITELLKSVILYISKKKLVGELSDIVFQIKNNSSVHADFIKTHRGLYSSLFYNESDINQLKESITYIKNISKNDLSAKFKSVNTEILKSAKINNDDAWEYYKNNSIEIIKILETIAPTLFSNDEDTFYGLPKDLAQEINDECFFPDGLLCDLRPYQEWGVKYILHQERVLLGDEMGLGKTVQAIAAMVSLKNVGAKHFMVICPASLVINWIREISKHSKLTPFKVHGNAKAQIFKSWQVMGGVAVTTYESLASLNFDENFKITQLIVDEAHYIKNINANRSKNTIKVCGISERVLLMTGTPLENNVDEMIALIDILQPKIAEKVKYHAYTVAASRFREMIIPVYYRRKREDVLKELPDLITKEEWCTMSYEEQEQYYTSLSDGHYMTVRRLSWNVDDLSFSSKANRLKEIIEEAKEEGRKVIVFSFFIEVIYKIWQHFSDSCMIPITGKVSPIKRQQIIDNFNAAPAGTVLLSQIVAGGTGLNLQSASVVVLCEPQIKPSIEQQAISRAYRMGQTRNVLVFKLLCEDTIDEKIQEILEQKQNEFDLYADKSLAAESFGGISDATMGKIIEEEIERIKREKNIDVKMFAKKEITSSSEDIFQEIIDETISNANKKIEENKPNSTYYTNLLSLTYNEIVKILLEKYGPVPGDYFENDISYTKNKSITKGNIGLSIHHIDEDKHIKLSDDKIARLYSFEFQKKDRLLYCDLLEHLILHIKIVEEKLLQNNIEYSEMVGIGGVIKFLVPQINDIYSDKQFVQNTAIENRKRIKDYFEQYISILKYLIKKTKNHSLFASIINKDTLSRTFDNIRLDKVYFRLN